MTRDEVGAALQKLIEEALPELGTVDLGKNMETEYGINSISLIRLIVAAENKFEVEFTDYELDIAGYATFGDLAASIASKMEVRD